MLKISTPHYQKHIGNGIANKKATVKKSLTHEL